MVQKGSKSEQDSGSEHKPWPRYRSRHRDRSHDAAHAEVDNLATQPLVDDPLVCAIEPSLVTTSAQLDQLIQHLRDVGSFGYDSEFIGEQSYYPQLCLIQVATPKRVALIDPLGEEAAPIDLTPFWELLADAKVEKIVHAGQPDLEPVVRHIQQPPRAIFDTQIAAAFAGLLYPMSLSKLLAEAAPTAGLRTNSNVKFSKWNHRPLTSAQIQYAADDVRFMPLLRDRLNQRLATVGNQAWAAEECESLSRAELYKFDADSQRVRVRGIEKLSRPKTAILRSLIAWRDRAAREHNVPPRTFLRDEIVHALALAAVSSVDDLKNITGLPRPVEREYGETIVQIAREAAALAEKTQGDDIAEFPPMSRQESDEIRARVDRLATAIEGIATARSVHPAIVTSKRELERVLRKLHQGRPVDDERVLHGWRRELLGDVVSNSA